MRPRRIKTPRTRGERVIAFIETYCVVPEGTHVGKPLKLAKFQKRFILAVYDNPAKTKMGILSMARKNAKTTTIAGIALAHIAGPEAVQNSQVVSGARSREQASIVFKLAWKMMGPELATRVRVVPSSKILIGLSKNVEYKALAAEGSTSQGLSPRVAILDEVGQIRGADDPFVNAITTAQGAYEDALLFAISTQAPSDADLFSVWIDDARTSQDPRIVCHVYEAPKGCELGDKEAWAAANPAMGEFRSADDLSEQAKKAQRMPSFEATFRNLILNQRVELFAPFVSKSVWDSNGAQPATRQRGMKVYGGLDLSSVQDLTALVLVSEQYDVYPSFWLPAEGIDEKSKADRVPYALWARQGLIELTPGRAIEYRYVAAQLKEVFEFFDVVWIGFDRWNMRYLRPYLIEVGFTDAQLARFKEFGQGFQSMSPALRELETKLLLGSLRHGNNSVLTMCAGNATILQDSTGNRKFAKQKTKGRIDGMVGLAMAIGVMPTAAEVVPEPKLFFA